ncbi:nuclear transport factor 2 family protein [Kineosporia succinea]|uniref:Ketosteroid isomerase-like protein n=1 Tax=Kineosporia succinea TaxID=84632 RepID=A0ABT9PE13_9ACTN|nr:nuclear transport factor 2 family protein [Kineosporia succinea]MDP9830937.1 ketosteroid isomerase-like protein [Kineosporia succinea]
MTANQTTALDLAKTFVEALEMRDADLIAPHLADDVVEVIPYSNTGKTEPWFVFNGKAEVVSYLNTIAGNFSRVSLLNQRYSVTDDGTAVFLQAEGDLVQAGSDAPYRNVYVFKFEIRDGQITHVDEYANPIAFAVLTGLPLG